MSASLNDDVVEEHNNNHSSTKQEELLMTESSSSSGTASNNNTMTNDSTSVAPTTTTPVLETTTTDTESSISFSSSNIISDDHHDNNNNNIQNNNNTQRPSMSTTTPVIVHLPRIESDDSTSAYVYETVSADDENVAVIGSLAENDDDLLHRRVGDKYHSLFTTIDLNTPVTPPGSVPSLTHHHHDAEEEEHHDENYIHPTNLNQNNESASVVVVPLSLNTTTLLQLPSSARNEDGTNSNTTPTTAASNTSEDVVFGSVVVVSSSSSVSPSTHESSSNQHTNTTNHHSDHDTTVAALSTSNTGMSSGPTDESERSEESSLRASTATTHTDDDSSSHHEVFSATSGYHDHQNSMPLLHGEPSSSYSSYNSNNNSIMNHEKSHVSFSAYDQNDLLLQVDDQHLPLWMKVEERLNVHAEPKPVFHPLPPATHPAINIPELDHSKYPHLQECHRMSFEPFTVLEREDPFVYRAVQFKSLSDHHSGGTHHQESVSNLSSNNLLSLTLSQHNNTSSQNQNTGPGKSIVDSFFKALYHLDSMATNTQLGKDQIQVSNTTHSQALLHDETTVGNVDSSHEDLSEAQHSLSPLKGSLRNIKNEEGLDGKRKGSLFALKLNKTHSSVPSSGQLDSHRGAVPKLGDGKMLLDGYDFLEMAVIGDQENQGGTTNTDTNNQNQTPSTGTPSTNQPTTFDSNQVQEEVDPEEQYLKKLSLVEFAKHSSAKRRVKQFDFISADSTFEKPPLIKKRSLPLGSPTSEEPPSIFNPETGALQITDNEVLPSSTARLMSCLKPNFKYRPLETSMCFRQPQNQANLTYPMKKRTQMVISFYSSPKFERPTNEINYYSIALYDLERGAKVSEDFHFHFVAPEQLETLSPWVQDYLQTITPISSPTAQEKVLTPRGGESPTPTITVEQKCLFSVTYPNDQIYLVIQVYRLPTSGIKDALKLYKKDSKQSEINDLEKQYVELKQQVAHFRQAIMFGYMPLFSKRGNVIHLMSTKFEVKPMYSIEGYDYKNNFDVISVIKTIQKEKKLKNMTQVDGGFLFRAEIYRPLSNSSKRYYHKHRSNEHSILNNVHQIVGSGSNQSYISSPQSTDNQLDDEHQFPMLTMLLALDLLLYPTQRLHLSLLQIRFLKSVC
ncbi:hypothetical protein C9374_001133 [Naegleria lovaniensis]|uniref:Uncharacterized protein n=1 Tax=Naegleria lovaniensis TaxID=51637 RepID=A0AA88GWR8_NAELO|nr:uncharacterized protein C9374_001133 [Naegleria lovaniensis]KAG2387539.1 hypothetical protein C9374_001133 [Naegleria lovaniensis]